MSSFSPDEWRQRFEQQAKWTQDLRRYLFSRLNLANAAQVLDLGCGTGALLPELQAAGPNQVVGLDILPAFLALASKQAPGARLTQGDAHRLPFADHTFDIVLCHFLLLWVASPLNVLREMRRVVRPGGYVLALAEPDYGGRIDYPPDLAQIGQAQISALAQQGANPHLGRLLPGLFHQAGLLETEYGLLGGQWQPPPELDAWELEWKVLELDLGDQIQPSEFHRLKVLDWAAWQQMERVLYVPTFYAIGSR